MIEHPDYYNKLEEFSDKTPLSNENINVFHIFKKPTKGSVMVLIINKPNTRFFNFYIQK
jgi:hypothetical protein